MRPLRVWVSAPLVFAGWGWSVWAEEPGPTRPWEAPSEAGGLYWALVALVAFGLLAFSFWALYGRAGLKRFTTTGYHALGALAIIVLALKRGELSDLERPKYEMMGLSPPTERPKRQAGRLGIEDRVIRLGLVGASLYYASRVGWTRPLGITLGLLGAYLLVTGLLGRDPLYYLKGWDSRLPEEGR